MYPRFEEWYGADPLSKKNSVRATDTYCNRYYSVLQKQNCVMFMVLPPKIKL